MAPTRAVPRTFAVLLTFLLTFSCGGRRQPTMASSQGGFLGMRYEVVPEGLVVRTVAEGGGAAAAGIVPGSLILEADGVSLVGRGADVQAAMSGPPGSIAMLRWRAPLSGASRQGEVPRRAIPFRQGPVPTKAPATVAALRRAARVGTPRELDAAVDALIADGFGGRTPGRALEGAFRLAAGRNLALAARLAERVAPHVGDDPLALAQLVEIASNTRDVERVLELSPRLEANRPPDLRLADGTAVDLGGGAAARTAWIDALWRVGQYEAATRRARDLLAVLDVPEVRARVGMAPAGARDAAWHGVGPPAPPVSLRTRAGQEWNLDANRGEVVLLAFWASWCRPCLDELPVLDALASARPGLRVLAVSMDDGPNALRDIDAMVASMGLSLPVAHAPELGRAYGVEALPSVRLIGRDGSVQLSARGHSAAGIRRLRAAVDAALAASTSAERPVGTRRGTGTFSMRSWRPLAGAGGITGAPGGAVVSVHGARPLRVGIAGEEPLDVSRGGEGGPIAWLGGPVTGEDGGYWLRAWHPDGAVRWFQTLPSRLVAVIADGRHLFVALEDELLVLAADGSVLARHELAARGLATGDDGDGVWAAAADTRVRLWVDASGRLQQKRSQAPGIRRVGPGGLVMTGLVRQAVMGPFGTGGEDRLVVALADGRVIGLDGAGRPALVLTLPDEVSLAVVQADDGSALLGIAVPELGIGLAALGLP